MNKEQTSGFLLGIGAGLALGVLFAPKAGMATRAAISNQILDTTNEVKQRASDVLHSATSAVDKGRTELVRAKESIKTAIDAGTKAFQESANA